jgi:hypothetical protein
MNVLTSGLHCTQGNIVIGMAKTDKVAIANQQYLESHPSVRPSNVTAKEILLTFIAMMLNVNPAAP